MAKKATASREAQSGRFVTASGRVLMEPVRGSKLSAAEIDRALAKSEPDKRKKG